MISGLLSCSSDDPVDLNGYWNGLNQNETTGKDWTFELYIEQDGSEFFVIYTDYRGSITARDVSKKGNRFEYLIDVYPETVFYSGKILNDTRISGTWVYSGDGNEGEWYLIKDLADSDPEEEDENTETSGSHDDPFSR